jgi:hypothetical protein
MKNEANQAARPQSKSEKTSALVALFGADVVERLRKRHPGLLSQADDYESADLTRVAWQKNRLLEKLRSDWVEPEKVEQIQERHGGIRVAGGASGNSPRAPSKVDAFIASSLSLTDLPNEHPAVIARVLRGLDREGRVSILQQLPGKTARAALRRLRAS